MNNQSESSSDQVTRSENAGSPVRKKGNIPLKIRLVRVFSSNTLKSPKSPRSTSNSRCSSPSRGSPSAKSSRYSWHLPPTNKEFQSPPSSESGISVSSSKSACNSAAHSPQTPSTPKTTCSAVWYADSR
ncbi:hypothetical protein KM043_014845 [Ampulex compressa]|nr:hypothetical protein KM043_014845 [Ampulex compressa]